MLHDVLTIHVKLRQTKLGSGLRLRSLNAKQHLHTTMRTRSGYVMGTRFELVTNTIPKRETPLVPKGNCTVLVHGTDCLVDGDTYITSYELPYFLSLSAFFLSSLASLHCRLRCCHLHCCRTFLIVTVFVGVAAFTVVVVFLVVAGYQCLPCCCWLCFWVHRCRCLNKGPRTWLLATSYSDGGADVMTTKPRMNEHTNNALL